VSFIEAFGNYALVADSTTRIVKISSHSAEELSKQVKALYVGRQ